LSGKDYKTLRVGGLVPTKETVLNTVGTQILELSKGNLGSVEANGAVILTENNDKNDVFPMDEDKPMDVGKGEPGLLEPPEQQQEQRQQQQQEHDQVTVATRQFRPLFGQEEREQ
jgi:hypothetical protein